MTPIQQAMREIMSSIERQLQMAQTLVTLIQATPDTVDEWHDWLQHIAVECRVPAADVEE